MATRLKRHKRIRKNVHGTEARPRLSVYRSNKNLQVQLINDDEGFTILGMSTKNFGKAKGAKSNIAKALGLEFGRRVMSMEEGKYKSIVFDRGGYRYRGRVKAFAEGLRESGLDF